MQFKRKKRRKLKSNQTKGKSKSKSTVIAKVKVVKKTNKKPNQKHPDKGKIQDKEEEEEVAQLKDDPSIDGLDKRPNRVCEVCGNGPKGLFAYRDAPESFCHVRCQLKLHQERERNNIQANGGDRYCMQKAFVQFKFTQQEPRQLLNQ